MIHKNFDKTKNSFDFWFPLVQQSGVKYPYSIIVPEAVEVDWVYFADFIPKSKRTEEAYLSNYNALQKFANEIKTYLHKFKNKKVFIRNAESSDKHFFTACCILQKDSSAEDIINLLLNNLQSLLVKDLLGSLDTWVLREYIDHDTSYQFNTVPSFGDMPLRSERRFFIKNNKTIANTEYWVQEALIHDEMVDTDYLAKLNNIPKEEIKFLYTETDKIAQLTDESWSVDWMKGGDGEWYCIDMALTANSWTGRFKKEELL